MAAMRALHPFTKFRRDHTPPMSQADLGRMLGVTRSCINRIESGERRPSMLLLATAKRITGLEPNTLRPDMRDIWQ